MIEHAMPAATLGEIAIRLLIAALCGAAVGFNREWHVKPAGLRTHALVALGAALVMAVGMSLSGPGVADPGAPSRVLQGILAGVGFIGAGAILRRPDRRGVHGLTTAASIWIVAAIGATCGAGLWRTAVVAVGIALVLLTAGAHVDRIVQRWQAQGEKALDDDQV